MSLSLAVHVREEHRDPVSGKLFDLGALGVEEQGEDLIGWFGDPGEADTLRAQMEQFVDALDAMEESRQPWSVKSLVIEDRDWNENWKSRWQEQFYGDTLSVCPSWLEPQDPSRTVIRIDPGNAFGTGTHESTALMLEWIDQLGSLDGKTVCDAGCGSGILAIAAILKGADFAYGFDIEVESIDTSRENARLNGCRVKTHFVQGTPRDLGSEYAFDLVFANIQRSVIEAFFMDLLRLTKPGGKLYVAGILKEEEAAMLALAREWQLEPPVMRPRGEWISICYTRPESLEF
jgi:ribosomal protein L11 methyltransferase